MSARLFLLLFTCLKYYATTFSVGIKKTSVQRFTAPARVRLLVIKVYVYCLVSSASLSITMPISIGEGE